ncbi:hypothetical protein HPB49_010020 [Dermacentor silvarum]|uniref:Uncharacterized protein n=1 Tax=Dermacentor silvarum TaxID=543639 RepID=A0ACB8CKI2_DERSI|nr:uncharacterized protein LOC119456215 [Dermacentor silvarum]KAH7945362.1 hypothetical protein HPB49_010020 [Dermacentor silvarum]
MNRGGNAGHTVTTRSALREITRSAYGSPPSVANMVYIGSPSPSTSPDEEVVRRRGRRIISPGNQFALTPPRTPTKRQQSPKSSSSSEHPQTPSKAQLMMSPVRSSPRKRLLLPADISDAVNASPSKKLVSPVKRLRLQSREAEAETEVALTALTKAQLVALLKDTMGRNAAAKQIVQELLPKPDLAHSMQKLEKLLHQIYRAFPQKHWGNSRDAFCFRRVQIPIETFKRKCLQRGQQLCQAEQWSSLLEYAQQAWNFARKMPEWQDSSHNKAKLLCLRTLAAHCSTALKKISLDQRQLQTLISRLKEMKDDSPCITSPLKLAEAQLEQCHQ